MSSSIKVYLFPDTIKYLVTNNLLDEIGTDVETKLNAVNKKRDPYVEIKGSFENNHKARIILQDIEKDNYRKAFLDKEL
jgi:hypothetical protein